MSTYKHYQVEDHEAFLCDQLLPLIVGYARSSNTPSDVVAMACFLTLATVLESKGLPREALAHCIKRAVLTPTHEAPRGLQ